MTIDQVLQNAQVAFDKVVEHLKAEFGRLQIGRASAALVDHISVEVYGSIQPMKAIASVSIPDPRTIQIQPWDKSCLSAIEKAIVGVGTGLNPVNDGICVRINIPPLTEERRIELTKHVKKLAETARIAVRTARQDFNTEFKKMKANDEITEDELFEAGEKLQAKVEMINKKIDEVTLEKEKDVMTV